MPTETWVTVYSRATPGQTCQVVVDYNAQNGNLTSLQVINQITGTLEAPERVVARIDWNTGQAPTILDPVPVGTTSMPRGQASKVENAAQWSLALVRG